MNTTTNRASENQGRVFGLLDPAVYIALGFGAFGGFLNQLWILINPTESSPTLDLYLSIPAFLALGSGASLVFVFLIANADRTDRIRLVALSVLSGFSFSYVLPTAQELLRGGEMSTVSPSPTEQKLVDQQVTEDNVSPENDGQSFAFDTAYDVMTFPWVRQFNVSSAGSLTIAVNTQDANEEVAAVSDRQEVDLVAQLSRVVDGTSVPIAYSDDSFNTLDPHITAQVNAGLYRLTVARLDPHSTVTGEARILVLFNP